MLREYGLPEIVLNKIHDLNMSVPKLTKTDEVDESNTYDKAGRRTLED